MKELLEKASAEIRMLRRQNELLAARVEVMDLFACVLHTRPAGVSMGASEDIAWALDRAAAEVERPSPMNEPAETVAEAEFIADGDNSAAHHPV
ncbi:MAG: hypothetical protein JWM58_567 [Rhizobium sp.]|nr:hypothetical protein [Rhizobium sp.]